MATNEVMKPGYRRAVVCDSPTTPASNAPVRVGKTTGVALLDEGDGGAGATETVVDFGPGVWELTVDDDLGTGIAVNDPLFYHDTGTGTGSVNVNNNPKNADAFFGFALETVSANGTTAIDVFHSPPAERKGTLKSAVIAGGAAGALTVTGIALKDRLVSVIRLNRDATAANIDMSDLTSEFTISAADTIDNTGGTATTGDALLVFYEDVSA